LDDGHFGLTTKALRKTKEALINFIPLMVRQAHHERNKKVTVHPELVEGFNQRFPKEKSHD
jgi:hypothetical protein